MFERVKRVLGKRRSVVIARDPMSGFAAVYLDGLLVHDFEEDPFWRFGTGVHNWGDALEVLFEKLDVDYDVEGRYQLSDKIQGFDYTEYDSYWPERLDECPVPSEEVFTAP